MEIMYYHYFVSAFPGLLKKFFFSCAPSPPPTPAIFQFTTYPKCFSFSFDCSTTRIRSGSLILVYCLVTLKYLMGLVAMLSIFLLKFVSGGL